MTREDYCSFELSKLLKEKGFDEYCRCYYFSENNERYYANEVPRNNHKLDADLACPTHEMAMKWLREKDVDIIIMPLFKLKEGRIYCYEIHSDNTDVRFGQFETYEEAVEAALKYSLEKLI